MNKGLKRRHKHQGGRPWSGPARMDVYIVILKAVPTPGNYMLISLYDLSWLTIIKQVQRVSEWPWNNPIKGQDCSAKGIMESWNFPFNDANRDVNLSMRWKMHLIALNYNDINKGCTVSNCLYLLLLLNWLKLTEYRCYDLYCLAC